ncbi:ATP-dependent DNA helicase [Nocardioides sp. CFH 31398]|uniref:ATP-dependent DNA helicase n=1 Tax=Nocardioides sp. CFH 31398 TaxID=2919579 RepID=UPI001F06F954|nr:ATP-dependent DNA helicase [Nocardioides sp. CFH 31398]MCH1866501.1 ATP-dependent helicase [Nocardioides sp. CFH 31398]
MTTRTEGPPATAGAPSAVAARRVDTPAELAALLGVDWEFSPQQFAAVTAPLAPGVVVAGAGSGKTAVMAARVVWLVATGRVQPHEVLGLTFTTKATAELQTRIRGSLRAAGLLPERGARPVDAADLDGTDEPEEPTVSTYHAYAAALLTEHGLRIGHEPDTRLIADASRYQLAAQAVQGHTAPVAQLTDHPQTVVQNLLALDAEMSEHLVDPATVRAHDARERQRFVDGMAAEHRKTYREVNEKAISAIDRRAELLDLVAAYRDRKAQLGAMDFSDQIALVARLADERPEVGAGERERFRVVLLDEYQDTSVAQALMLSRLFSGPDEASGLGHPVTAVGDPHQAIYGWRGASVSNILEFARDFPPLAGEPLRYPLTVNRRSDARILATANHLAADLYAAREELDPLEPAPGAAEGSVTCRVHETAADELAWLADAVRATHDELAAAAPGGATWREIAVLTRDNKQAAAVFDALSDAEVPVEIVGLKGLLRLPEVAEVLACLTLADDVTANAALLTLLAGPRWAVGPRDLALLGSRARELATVPAPSDAEDGAGAGPRADLREDLLAAVAGADATELPCLCDALDDPGDRPYSPQARERFGLLATELRRLRAAAGEPVLDLVRRVLDVTGIDVELDSSVSPAASARRDNLDLFVQAVADFQAIDGRVSLPALLAWLEAEDEYGQGLDVAVPSEADSVKLLTVHRAKGLEWDAVFVVGVCESKFPTRQTRSTWLTVPAALPMPLRGDARDLPTLGGHTPDDVKALLAANREHAGVEELRLAYVGWTRARHRLTVSAHCWTRGRKSGLGPSAYLEATRQAMAAWGAEPDAWLGVPARGEPNPVGEEPDQAWPIAHHSTREVQRRHEAARRVREADPDEPDALEDVLLAEQVARWDAEIDRLLAEAAGDAGNEVAVPLPPSVSATSVSRLRDPAAYARELARPLPRPPSSAARAGTDFHSWVEQRFGQQQLIDPDELDDRADARVDDPADFEALVAAFEAGPFADRAPHAVEAAFALVLAGQVVRGRIDAVYAEPDGTWLLVDWKTGHADVADPWQLAVYRVAWAELVGVDVDSVRAAFFFVRTGSLVVPDALPDRAALEATVRA